ncbi:MAG: hypothetical protein ACI9U2_004486, partial [Bradymonadia bacterium]
NVPDEPVMDRDGDGVPDDDDNCADIANASQSDLDDDGLGDACDDDRDGDGLNGGVDNCPDVFNPDQFDADGDGIGDACDADNTDDPSTQVTGSSPLSECSQTPGRSAPGGVFWLVLVCLGLSRRRD